MKLTFNQTYNGSCVDLEKELGLNRGDIQQIETDWKTMTLTVKDGIDTEIFDDMFNSRAKIKKLEAELADLKTKLIAAKVIK